MLLTSLSFFLQFFILLYLLELIFHCILFPCCRVYLLTGRTTVKENIAIYRSYKEHTANTRLRASL